MLHQSPCTNHLSRACLLVLFLPSVLWASDLAVLSSKHYKIHTDLDSALAEDLARRMDAMFGEYSRRLVDFQPDHKLALFDVYLFQNQQDYTKFIANRFPNTGGVFMSARNILAAFLEHQGRDTLRRTLQHEAFHQFAHTTISTDLPLWLNEGLAQLFEEGLWTGSGFMLNQVPPRRIRQLQADMENRRLIDFQTFLALSHEQWKAKLTEDAVVGATQYNQAWAIVHFLVNATDSSGNQRYRARLVAYLKLIHDGADPASAFTKTFSNNVPAFQQRFVEYARTLTPTPEATYLERQEILADMLVELKTRGQTFPDVSTFRQIVTAAGYRLTYTRPQLRWKTEPDPLIYFSDLAGNVLPSTHLFFQPRNDAPLPDLICCPADHHQFRTRFHPTEEKLEHETLIEPR